MRQYIVDIAYMIVGIGLMSMVFIVGIVGIVKMYKETKDKE